MTPTQTDESEPAENSDTFDFETQGRHSAAWRRPFMPADLACHACGGAIGHGDAARCRACDAAGVNEYGRWSACEHRVLACRGCGGG